MRKLFLLLSILLTAPFLARGADANDLMLLQMKDSSVKQFELASKPEVTFQGAELVIWSSQTNTRVGVSMDEVKSFEFGSSSALGEIAKDAVKVSFDDNSLTVSGLPEGAVLSIYDVAGHELATVKADADGVAAADLSQFQPGVYLIRSNDISLKIYRK